MVARTPRITSTPGFVTAVPTTAANLATIQRRLQRKIRTQAPIVSCAHCRFELGLAALPVEGPTCELHSRCGICVLCAQEQGVKLTHGPATTLCASHCYSGVDRDVSPRFCPQRYRTARLPFPAGFFMRSCLQHSNFDLICPDCRGSYTKDGCRYCGNLGAVFFTPIEAACYVFGVPYIQYTNSASWLAILIADTAVLEEWDAEKWEEVHDSLVYLMKPGAPWSWPEDTFAQMAMRLVLTHVGIIQEAR